MIRPVKCRTKAEMVRFLSAITSSEEGWSQKKLDRLWYDLEAQRYKLGMHNDKPVLLASRIALSIYDIVNENVTHELREEMIASGQRKPQDDKLFTLSDKIRPPETMYEGALRCIEAVQKELGFEKQSMLVETEPKERLGDAVQRLWEENPLTRECFLFFKANPRERPGPPMPKYPGLSAIRRYYVFICVIPRSIRDLTGYTFTFKGRKGIYGWYLLKNKVEQYSSHVSTFE